MRFLLIVLLVAGVYAPAPAQSKQLTGKAVKIIDGDTFDLLVGTTTFRVRLQGIDCPEKKQPYSAQATAALGRWCGTGPLVVRYSSKDRSGRILGDVYTRSGTWVNLELVKQGMAWHFKKYSSDRQLAAAEQDARKRSVGLWQQRNPVAPWLWRKGVR
jgi:endonuclease YncB( thermonuclease family)